MSEEIWFFSHLFVPLCLRMDKVSETERPTWIQRLHAWRVEHVSDRMFLLVLAFFVGLFSAVAAFVLHGMINQIVALLTGQFSVTSYNWLYLVYPVIGIYLTSLCPPYR